MYTYAIIGFEVVVVLVASSCIESAPGWSYVRNLITIALFIDNYNTRSMSALRERISLWIKMFRSGHTNLTHKQGKWTISDTGILNTPQNWLNEQPKTFEQEGIQEACYPPDQMHWWRI